MTIALSEEHESLRLTAQRWLATHCPPSEPRAAAEDPAATLPPVWEKLAAQDWLGLHLPEERGGQGFGLLELAVVLEELGAALFPGPLLPTVLASAVLSRVGGARERAELLPGLADGSLTAAVAFGRSRLDAGPAAGGALRISGTVRPVLGLPGARVLLVPVATGDGCSSTATAPTTRSRWRSSTGLDATRPVCHALRRWPRPPEAEQIWASDELVRGLALALGAAESAGIARWCLDTASEYAKVRVQFGRPIGQFQAVKHALADMLVAVEQCAAVAWDAAVGVERATTAEAPEGARLVACIAGSVALPAAVRCAKQCVQTLGGIGFTWEHDAHLYLKRAVANLQLLAGGDVGALEEEVTALAVAGARRDLTAELPEEAESLREASAGSSSRWRRSRTGRAQRGAGRSRLDHAALARAVGSGLVAPGAARHRRGAGPRRRVPSPSGRRRLGPPDPDRARDAEQQERWVRPTLFGRLSWCQLFSEPGAGSDLAALSTRATRVEGGYVLNGQKVWTSLAQSADFGICLARSDPDAPKHAGITFLVVDMRAEGIDIRPLRELTGAAMFNEVFFDDVFVPDDAVVERPATAGASGGPHWPTSACRCPPVPRSATGSSR